MLRRSTLSELLDRTGVLKVGLRVLATAWPRRALTVLLYHRVIDLDRVGDLDPDSVDATPHVFDQQMAILRRHFVPVGLDDALAACRDPVGHPLPPNSVLVTFDDGYRDNLEVAVPILARHRIRATFFIATGYTNDRRLYWWERLSLMVRHSKAPTFSLGYPAPFSTPLASDADRRKATRHVLRLVKDSYDLDLDRLYQEVSSTTGVPWSRADDERHAQAILDWNGVRALEAAGMDVASHTREHRILQTLPPDRLASELAESKAKLETELGHPVRALAYPVGKRLVAYPAVRDAVRAAGYDVGFVVQPGVNDLAARGTDLYDLKRIPVDRAWSMAHFRATLVHHAFAG